MFLKPPPSRNRSRRTRHEDEIEHANQPSDSRSCQTRTPDALSARLARGSRGELSEGRRESVRGSETHDWVSRGCIGQGRDEAATVDRRAGEWRRLDRSHRRQRRSDARARAEDQVTGRQSFETVSDSRQSSPESRQPSHGDAASDDICTARHAAAAATVTTERRSYRIGFGFAW